MLNCLSSRRIAVVLATLLFSLIPELAFSQSPETSQTSEVPQTSEAVEQRLGQLEAEVQRLRQSRIAGPPPPSTSEDDAFGSLTEPWDDCTLPGDQCAGDGSMFGNHGDPKYPTVKLTGFFQADWGWFNQDLNNVAAVGDLQDGGDFRRTRLAAKGDVWDNVGYIIEMDFSAPGRPSFMDVWAEIRDVPVFNRVRIGQFRQPIGMGALTSVRELPFLECALPFAFLPFRQLGVMAHGQSENQRVTWAASAFRFPTDAFGGNVGDNGGYATAARVTWLPLYEDDGEFLIHVGAATSFGDPANNRVRYRNQPEFFVAETGGADLVPGGVPSNVPPFVDTGPIAANNFTIPGVEAAAVWHSFYIQSELLYSIVNQIGGPTLTFPGLYAHMGLFLTGETRPYNRANGVFSRIKPLDPVDGKGGLGAWEVAARWSYLDLNDAAIRGGRLQDVTIGLNWYLNPFMKFQVNYIRAFLASPISGDSTADIIAARAQVDF